MLLADTDPQANPTASAGQKNADALKMPVSDAPEAIMPEKDVLSENMILHHDEGINLIPGIIRPADIDRKLTEIFVKEKTPTEGIESITKDYDCILIDCSITLGNLRVKFLLFICNV